MGSKGHFYISMSKSVIRIVTCFAALVVADITKDIAILAGGFLVAELLGVAEELADKR